MQVSKDDLECVDAIIRALNKLRFDVNGVECMQLASQLAAFGNLRGRIAEELKYEAAEHDKKIQEALKKLNEPPPAKEKAKKCP